MIVHEFGKGHGETVLFLQGSISSWRWYSKSIDALAEKYHVIVPVLEGHEDSGRGDFISVEKSAADVTSWMLEHGFTDIFGVYAMSFGGSMILIMMAEEKIKFRKVLIDGGIAPRKKPSFGEKVSDFTTYMIINTFKWSPRAIKMKYSPEHWVPDWETEKETYERVAAFMKNISSVTMKRVFIHHGDYALPSVPRNNAEVEYWYGSVEKNCRKGDIEWISKNMPHAKIVENMNMDHGEVSMNRPEIFIEKALAFFSL